MRPRDVAAPAIHARVCANSSSESFGSSLNRAMIKAPTMAAQLPIAARRFSAAVLGLHLELGPKGVYVQAVLPSATRTEIWERSGRDVNALPAVWTPRSSVLIGARPSPFRHCRMRISGAPSMALGWPCSRISCKPMLRPDTALRYEPRRLSG